MSTNRFSEKQKKAPTQHKHTVFLIHHLVFLIQIILKVNFKCRLIESVRYCRGEFQQSFCKAQCFYQYKYVVSKNTFPMTSIVL